MHGAATREFTLIADQPGLEAVAARIRDHGELALDTEADNQWHYETLLCLMQIEVGGAVFLVDLLAERLEPAPLFAALEGRDLVMHGSDFDLRLLQEHSRFRPATLFDTMIAAQLCGRARFGLASLLEEMFGLKVSKKHQKANWSRRPMGPELLEYAAMDARMLRPIRDRLHADLARLGRLEWLRQRCAQQIETASTGFEKQDAHAWRIGGSERLRPQGQAVLYELWHWRDREARRLDWPPFKVLQAGQLLDLSARAAEGAEGPLVDRILSTKGGRRFRGLVEAIEAGRARDPRALPRRESNREDRVSLTAEEQAFQERVRERRDALAKDLGIDPTLIANRAQMTAIVRRPEVIAEVLLPWQAELVAPLVAAG